MTKTTTHGRRKCLIAFLDDSPAASKVLAAAFGVAQLVGAEVSALHVLEPGGDARILSRVANASGVDLQLNRGPVEKTILEALEDPRVFGGVIGMRGFPGGSRPAGRVALQVISNASKPVVLVPPDGHIPSDYAPRHLLVPLDGSVVASEAFLGLEQRFPPDSGREIGVLLIFDGVMPTMVNHHPHGIEAWGSAFVDRHCPGAQRTFYGQRGRSRKCRDRRGRTDP